jgi:hypothetical protein
VVVVTAVMQEMHQGACEKDEDRDDRCHVLPVKNQQVGDREEDAGRGEAGDHVAAGDRNLGVRFHCEDSTGADRKGRAKRVLCATRSAA